jgi:hypothetical protein
MRKFAFVVAGVVTLMLVGFAGWNAEATILIVHPEPNYSLAQNAGCWLPGLPSECDTTHIANAHLVPVGILGGNLRLRTKGIRVAKGFPPGTRHPVAMDAIRLMCPGYAAD